VFATTQLSKLKVQCLWLDQNCRSIIAQLSDR